MSDRADDIKFEMKNIVIALKDVIAEWHDLGLQLGLPESILKLIGCSPDIEGHLRMMVSNWLDYDPEASWDKLANALNGMGKNTIAANIRINYMGAVISQTIPEDSPAIHQDEAKARRFTVLHVVRYMLCMGGDGSRASGLDTRLCTIFYMMSSCIGISR